MTIRVLAPADTSLAAGLEFELDPEESRYLGRVRRAKAGDAIEVLGPSSAHAAEVLDAGGPRRPARVRLGEARDAPARDAPLHLLVGLVERSATLEAVKHATALDAAELWLCRCARSQQAPPKPARLEAAIDAARRQCGRPDRPPLRYFGQLEAALVALGDLEGVTLFLADPAGPPVSRHGPTSMDAAPSPPPNPGSSRRALAVGPEGGFDPAEVRKLRAFGAQALGLGPWILRTELAVAVGLARLQAGT